MRNDSGPVLVGDGLQVGQAINLRDGFTATRTIVQGVSPPTARPGAVRLTGAYIGGGLDCTNAHLRSDTGPALSASGLQVGQTVFLSEGFTATGTTDAGAIRLTGAHVGSLECYGQVSLRNDTGPALSASGLQVGQNIVLYHGFTATAAHTYGAVYLRGAHIDGNLDCRGAKLLNNSGPALSADSVQVGQTVFLSEGFTAKAVGAYGAVYLRGAHIGGSLDCDGAWLTNNSGPALSAVGVQVGQDMRLSNGFDTTGSGAEAAVDLTGARADGALAFRPKGLKHATDPHRRLAVDGLTYTGVPQQISAQHWLDLLRDGTAGYAAQPYQQLAAGYRALGDERQARKILMAQRNDELARTQPRPRWSERLWGKTTKITLGYGYQPWKALLFLAGVLVISCLLAWVLGSHGALAQTDKTATPGRPCTVIQQLSIGVDLNLPVGTSVARAGCDLTKDSASTTAAWLTAIGWVLRLLAWAFAALFIAGFTSAVRKT